MLTLSDIVLFERQGALCFGVIVEIRKNASLFTDKNATIVFARIMAPVPEVVELASSRLVVVVSADLGAKAPEESIEGLMRTSISFREAIKYLEQLKLQPGLNPDTDDNTPF